VNILRSRTRHYATPWGIRRVKVWKIGPFVVWRRRVHDRGEIAS
jgi:hypothetical protein